MVTTDADRRAEDRARAIAGAAVDVLVEARVGVGGRDVHALARRRHAAGDAPADRHADLAHLQALRDLRPQLAALLVHHEQRRAVGVEQPRGLVHDDLQQAGEVELAAERLDGLQQLRHLARIGVGDEGRGRRRRSPRRRSSTTRTPSTPASSRAKRANSSGASRSTTNRTCAIDPPRMTGRRQYTKRAHPGGQGFGVATSTGRR
jgi:hypothetical protein